MSYAFLIFYTGILYRCRNARQILLILLTSEAEHRYSLRNVHLSRSFSFFFQSNDSDGMLDNEAVIYAWPRRKVYAISLTHNASPVLNSGAGRARERNDYKL